MIHRIDATLRAESRRFRLVFTCERCAVFDPEAVRCSFGYPIAPHHAVDLDAADEVVFCKTFELL